MCASYAGSPWSSSVFKPLCSSPLLNVGNSAATALPRLAAASAQSPRFDLHPSSAAALSDLALALVLDFKTAGALMPSIHNSAPLLKMLFAGTLEHFDLIGQLMREQLPKLGPLSPDLALIVGALIDEALDASASLGDVTSAAFGFGFAAQPQRGLAMTFGTVSRNDSFSGTLLRSLTSVPVRKLVQDLPAADEVPYIAVIGDADSSALLDAARVHVWGPLLARLGNATTPELALARYLIAEWLEAPSALLDGAAIAFVDNAYVSSTPHDSAAFAVTPGIFVRASGNGTALAAMALRRAGAGGAYANGLILDVLSQLGLGAAVHYDGDAGFAALPGEKTVEAALLSASSAEATEVAAPRSYAARHCFAPKDTGFVGCLETLKPSPHIVGGVTFQRQVASLAFGALGQAAPTTFVDMVVSFGVLPETNEYMAFALMDDATAAKFVEARRRGFLKAAAAAAESANSTFAGDAGVGRSIAALPANATSSAFVSIRGLARYINGYEAALKAFLARRFSAMYGQPFSNPWFDWRVVEPLLPLAPMAMTATVEGEASFSHVFVEFPPASAALSGIGLLEYALPQQGRAIVTAARALTALAKEAEIERVLDRLTAASDPEVRGETPEARLARLEARLEELARQAREVREALGARGAGGV
jgi:hypothetical protein